MPPQADDRDEDEMDGEVERIRIVYRKSTKDRTDRTQDWDRVGPRTEMITLMSTFGLIGVVSVILLLLLIGHFYYAIRSKRKARQRELELRLHRLHASLAMTQRGLQNRRGAGGQELLPSRHNLQAASSVDDDSVIGASTANLSSRDLQLLLCQTEVYFLKKGGKAAAKDSIAYPPPETGAKTKRKETKAAKDSLPAPPGDVPRSISFTRARRFSLIDVLSRFNL